MAIGQKLFDETKAFIDAHNGFFEKENRPDLSSKLTRVEEISTSNSVVESLVPRK